MRLLKNLILAFAVLTPSVAVIYTPPAIAQDASVEAIALPFIGSYEVWCTSRNPSPGICTNHHTTPAIDVGMAVGTPVYATGDGTVFEVESGCGTSWCRGGAGNFIAILHADGRYSRYLHLDTTAVERGQTVSVGEQIGTSGATGQATAAHLHYDEHAFYGTRTPFGEWIGCVDGQQVAYPSSLGYESWNDVPFGTKIINEDFDCLTEQEISGHEVIILNGDETIGLTTALPEATPITYKIQINGRRWQQPAFGGDIISFPLAEEATASIQMRVDSEGTWSTSVPVSSTSSDQATCRGLFATGQNSTNLADVLIGSSGSDTISGGSGGDYICGGTGSDTLSGGSGNDFIDGGGSSDTIYGDEGHDVIVGRGGSDFLFGGPGRDRINGSAANDLIEGGRGHDFLLGGSGKDTIRGGAGHDRIRGGAGNDTMFGDRGNDKIWGNSGVNIINAGAGKDFCRGAAHQSQTRCET